MAISIQKKRVTFSEDAVKRRDFKAPTAADSKDEVKVKETAEKTESTVMPRITNMHVHHKPKHHHWPAGVAKPSQERLNALKSKYEPKETTSSSSTAPVSTVTVTHKPLPKQHPAANDYVSWEVPAPASAAVSSSATPSAPVVGKEKMVEHTKTEHNRVGSGEMTPYNKTLPKTEEPKKTEHIRSASGEMTPYNEVPKMEGHRELHITPPEGISAQTLYSPESVYSPGPLHPQSAHLTSLVKVIVSNINRGNPGANSAMLISLEKRIDELKSSKK